MNWYSWAAGLFEGEGCVTKRGYLTLSNNDLDVLELYMDTLEIGTIRVSDTRNQVNYSHDIYKRSDVVRVAQILAPWLGRRRRADMISRLNITLPPAENKTDDWAAGLFEGEGSVWAGDTPSRPDNIFIRAKLGSTDQDVIQAFQEHLGTGNTFFHRYPNPAHKDSFTWQCSGTPVFELHRMIKDYLSSRRSFQFESALKMRLDYETNTSFAQIKRQSL